MVEELCRKSQSSERQSPSICYRTPRGAESWVVSRDVQDLSVDGLAGPGCWFCLFGGGFFLLGFRSGQDKGTCPGGRVLGSLSLVVFGFRSLSLVVFGFRGQSSFFGNWQGLLLPNICRQDLFLKSGVLFP